MIKFYFFNVTAYLRNKIIWTILLVSMFLQFAYLQIMLVPSLRIRPLETMYDHLAGVGSFSPVSMRVAGRWYLAVGLAVLIMFLTGLVILNAKKAIENCMGLPDMLLSVLPVHRHNPRVHFILFCLLVFLVEGALLLVGMFSVQYGNEYLNVGFIHVGSAVLYLAIVFTAIVAFADILSRSTVSSVIIYLAYYFAGGLVQFFAGIGYQLVGFQTVVSSLKGIAHAANLLSMGMPLGVIQERRLWMMTGFLLLVFGVSWFQEWNLPRSKNRNHPEKETLR